MRGFTNKDSKHNEALEQVRQWTRARFGLPADAVILVAEMACGLPGCPPLETVVVFWLGEKRHQFKIFKRLAEVALDVARWNALQHLVCGITLAKIMEDVRTHYEVAYTPISDNYDGHFRKIEVKLLRAKLTVQSRSGYFALPDLEGRPLQVFEVAGLQALDSKPLPHAFDFQAAALRFRPGVPTVQ